MDIGLLPLLRTEPLVFVLIVASLIGAIGLHEYAHALAADLQGDRLPRAMGRLTPNPIRHLDPLGTALIVLVGFGWGKPVEFRPQALASKRFGAAIVALAGPMTNLGLALLGALILGLLGGEDAPTIPRDFLVIFVSINVILAVFNLIPLPPLDGSRLLTIFLPPKNQKIVFWLDRWGFLILVVVLMFGGFTFLDPFIDQVRGWIFDLAGVI